MMEQSGKTGNNINNKKYFTKTRLRDPMVLPPSSTEKHRSSHSFRTPKLLKSNNMYYFRNHKMPTFYNETSKSLYRENDKSR